MYVWCDKQKWESSWRYESRKNKPILLITKNKCPHFLPIFENAIINLWAHILLFPTHVKMYGKSAGCWNVILTSIIQQKQREKNAQKFSVFFFFFLFFMISEKKNFRRNFLLYYRKRRIEDQAEKKFLFDGYFH